MVADISPLMSFLAPISVFILAFLVTYAVLRSTKLLGGVSAIDVTVGIIIAIIFASVTSARDYIQTVVPWFVILIVALFFIIFIISFLKGDFSKMKWLGIVFIVLLALVFILSAFKVFNLEPYLPGQSEAGGSSILLDFKHWILEDAVLGAILLIIIAGIVVWVVLRK